MNTTNPETNATSRLLSSHHCISAHGENRHEATIGTFLNLKKIIRKVKHFFFKIQVLTHRLFIPALVADSVDDDPEERELRNMLTYLLLIYN